MHPISVFLNRIESANHPIGEPRDVRWEPVPPDVRVSFHVAGEEARRGAVIRVEDVGRIRNGEGVNLSALIGEMFSGKSRIIDGPMTHAILVAPNESS